MLWAAEELGLAYAHVPWAHDDPRLKSPAFLAISPAGTIPAITEGDFALAESLAITIHLACRAGALLPACEAELWRWMLWAQQHLEPWVTLDAPVLEVRAAAPAQSAAILHAALAHLDRHLAGRDWVIGADFSIADLNLAAILSPSRLAAAALAPFPALAAWLATCRARPALLAVRRRFA